MGLPPVQKPVVVTSEFQWFQGIGPLRVGEFLRDANLAVPVGITTGKILGFIVKIGD